MPTTTTGLATSFIQFTRTSNATVTDSDGKIKWAGHNLLTNSESFDASAWLKTHGTSATPVVTANAAAAPNGTTTADRVDFGAIDAAGDYSVMYQTFTALDTSYTAGVWVKALAAGDVGKKVWLYLFDTANRGQITITLTADWQYVSTTATLTSGTRSFYLSTLGSDFGGSNQAAASVLVWGAHLYRSDLGSMVLNPARGDAYYPTTPRNLLGFTEDLSNPYWVLLGVNAAAPTRTTVSGVAPNGLTTNITRLSVPGTVVTSFDISFVYGATNLAQTSSTSVTGSIWIRRVSGGSKIGIACESTTSGPTSGGHVGSLVDVPDTWTRVSVSGPITGTAAGNWMLAIGFDGRIASHRSQSAIVLEVWGAQLSDSASLDAYSPVYGAAVTSAAYYAPRLDFDPATLAARGLLVEEQRGNAVTYSSDFTQWSQGGSSAVTANVVVAPDGTTTADDIERVAADSDRRLLTVSFTGDGSKALSVFVKYNTSPSFLLRLYDSSAAAERAFIEFTFTAGVPAAGTPSAGSVEAIENVGGGWYRIKIVASGVVAANTNQFMIYPARAGSANGQKTTFWGAQAEVQTASFSTSLIPTNGATATRTADLAGVSTQSFPFSASEGTLVANGTFIAPAQSGVSTMVSLSDGSSAESINIYRQNSQMQIGTIDGGVSQAGYTTTAPSNLTKAAIAYKLNDTNSAVNGTVQTTDTTCTVPTVNTMDIGRMWSNAFGSNGWIRQITYLPRRISNAELATRTA